MKNKNLIILVICIIGLIIIITSSFTLKKRKITGTNLSFMINKSSKCTSTKVISLKNYDVYLYCVDELFVSDNDTKVTLKEYLNNQKENGVENIIKNLSHEWAMFDGGTEKLSNDQISLIKCRKLDYKEDVYLGPKNMEYSEDFCATPKEK